MDDATPLLCTRLSQKYSSRRCCCCRPHRHQHCHGRRSADASTSQHNKFPPVPSERVKLSTWLICRLKWEMHAIVVAATTHRQLIYLYSEFRISLQNEWARNSINRNTSVKIARKRNGHKSSGQLLNVIAFNTCSQQNSMSPNRNNFRHSFKLALWEERFVVVSNQRICCSANFNFNSIEFHDFLHFAMEREKELVVAGPKTTSTPNNFGVSDSSFVVLSHEICSVSGTSCCQL